MKERKGKAKIDGWVVVVKYSLTKCKFSIFSLNDFQALLLRIAVLKETSILFYR